MSDERARQPAVFAGAATTTGASKADVEIATRASVRALRVLERPRTRMGVDGSGDIDKHSVSTRRNLPRPLKSGGVYRDVRIRRRVSGRLRDPK